MERVLHPEILSLELSDLDVKGATLWQWSQGPGFDSALRRALKKLHEGRAQLPSSEPLPACVSGFDAVFVTGGRSADARLRESLSSLPFVVIFDDEPVHCGERGGFDLLASRGLSGWVLDLGKTQLKLSVSVCCGNGVESRVIGAAGSARRWAFPRDWQRLPLSGEVSLKEWPAQKRRLREFIALKLQFARIETGRSPQGLVFALPAKLDADGTPHECNYAGMKGDRSLLPEAIELAGMGGLPIFVLNDGELAAFSVRLDPRLARFGKVLVLTLGFGIGAALVHRAVQRVA